MNTVRLEALSLTLCAALLLGACDNRSVPQKAIISQTGFTDVASVTLTTGSVAPEFSLQDLNGDWVKLSKLRGTKVLMVFYRGHWRPFCVGHLQDIQTVLPEFENLGYQVLAISPDDATGMQKMTDRMDRPYPFLSDKALEVTGLYGIRHDDEIPHPAMILLDQQGIVPWFNIGEDYKQRPSSAQMQ